MRQFLYVFDVTDLDFWLFKLKIGKPLTPALTNVHSNFCSRVFFVFELKALAGQTDGMTGQIRNAGY